MEKWICPIIVGRCKKSQEKKGRERLRTSPVWLWFLMLLTIAVTIFLIFWHRIFSLWILALLVALVLGHLWVTSFLKFTRNCIYCLAIKREEEIDDIYTESLAIPAIVTGVVERVFFGALVAFNIQAAGAAIGLWIVVKMGTDWQRLLQEDKNKKTIIDSTPLPPKGKNKIGPRSLAWASLLAGVISLLFAVIGGLICRAALPPCLRDLIF